MTGSDLIVLTPWLVFAASLAVVCLLLVRSRRRQDPQETRCPENHEPARPL
jgi:hypothetical protein